MPDAAIGRNIFQCLASGSHVCQEKKWRERERKGNSLPMRLFLQIKINNVFLNIKSINLQKRMKLSIFYIAVDR